MKKIKILLLTALLLFSSGLLLVACSSGQASIADNISVEFYGYSGDGTAGYDYNQFYNDVYEISLKKAGISAKDAKAIVDGDTVVFARLRANDKSSAKIDQAMTMANSVTVELDKTEKLSNGDTLVLSVLTSSQESPVKSEIKELTVSGLEEYEIVSIEDVAKEATTLYGFDGFGFLDYDTSYFSRESKAEHLSNNDIVTLVPDSYYIKTLKEEGKNLDVEEYDYLVSGLEAITSISNLSDLQAKNDTYIKSHHSNSSPYSYSIEKQKDFITYIIPPNSISKYGEVKLATVYKVHQTGGNDRVGYKVYSHRASLDKNGKLDIGNAEGDVRTENPDYEYVIANLENDGYKEITLSSTGSSKTDIKSEEKSEDVANKESGKGQEESETTDSDVEEDKSDTNASSSSLDSGTSTANARWSDLKSRQLAHYMEAFGLNMNQPNYVNIYDTPRQLVWNGNALDVDYQLSGVSDADYTIVAAYEYDRGGGLYHRYHFAILRDGSTSILYSEGGLEGNSLTLSKLNTENSELKAAFASIVNP